MNKRGNIATCVVCLVVGENNSPHITGGCVEDAVVMGDREHCHTLYTWLMSPEQEQLLCAALVHLGPVETEQGLHAEGVRKIQEVMHCTLADARTMLRELRVRKRIEETTTPIEQLDQPHFRWVQPSA